MDNKDFIQLSDSDDALYRAFGVLVAQLHRGRIIEASALTSDMRLLASKMAQEEPERPLSAQGLRQIAGSIDAATPGWSELRAVQELYRPGVPGSESLRTGGCAGHVRPGRGQ
ncbi:MAG: hypothetical protein KKB95_09535 [Gammaproteobacteria bacterium]|nr:hypothetical protein [Gammaproteobacteria bacterium]MBU1505803.1 hypothetical protein [Gammaproteobacteria bacterium]MBU2119491.1 hypothetical protein [Gammaproteobacteria bacterium]MBU2172603.1 hypothetical protein [Gammaproteobacteria bacterium]MBU2202061.1 hypothetical protein [Gammaproteobacteria bacterium]